MLMPAAVMIVIVLGSIAVDFAVVFLGEREAASLATAAANDAAAAAVDEQGYRSSGEFRIDEQRARRVALAAMHSSSSELRAVEADIDVVTVGGEPAVVVTVRGTVDYVFARAIPGAPDGTQVEASATAVARVG
jgi:hypothetical protein